MKRALILMLLVLGSPADGLANCPKGRHQQLRILQGLWRCRACGGSGWCIFRGVESARPFLICETCKRNWPAHQFARDCPACKGTGGWR